MKRFFRLEYEGSGVYNCYLTGCYKVLDQFNLRSSTNKSSPNPIYDKLLVRNANKRKIEMSEVRFSGDWRFGFTTKRKLLKWFNPACVKKLAAIGIKIIVIENIKDSMVIRGQSQDVICKEAYDKLYHKKIPVETFLS